MNRIHKMGHSFLFERGTWTAQGFFRDGEGRTVQASGKVEVSHEGDIWINEGYMELETDSPVRLRNRYEIVPFLPGSDTTTWTSSNPALGKLTGKFIIAGDSILSSYVSEDGKYEGTEFLKMIDSRTYANRGALLTSGKLVSIWSVTLNRI